MVAVDGGKQDIGTDIEFASRNQQWIMNIFLNNTCAPTIRRGLFNNRFDLIKVFSYLDSVPPIGIFTWLDDPDVTLWSCSLKQLRLIISLFFFWRVKRLFIILLILNSILFKFSLLFFVFDFLFKFHVSLSETIKLRII